MKNISLEGKGMAGVIEATRRYFLGLIKDASDAVTVPTSVITAAPVVGKRPPFKPIEGPLSVSNPFQNLESNQLFGTYVTINDVDVECLIEVIDWRSPDRIDRRWAGEPMDDGEVTFGDCFTLRGVYVDLSPEELDRIEREWKA